MLEKIGLYFVSSDSHRSLVMKSFPVFGLLILRTCRNVETVLNESTLVIL